MNRLLRLLTLLLLTPAVSNAATIQGILTAATDSLSSFAAVGVGIALVVFIWGLVQFIYASGDEKAIEVGRERMVWGIVALFFVVSVWGIVGILQTMLGVGSVNQANNCTSPTVTADGGTVCF